MRILCLGNNTEDTDVKTRRLAEQQSVKCHGLISELDHVIDLESIQYSGYYHSSVYDLEYHRLIEIAQEYKKINLIKDHNKKRYSNFDFVKIENIKKLYVAGGEPTAMPEFYNFVDQCIKDKKTNFEFVVNTNGTKLSDRFKQQLKEFSDFQFIVSIDGFNKLNHYIRWPSDWQKIIDNVQYLKQQNYVVSFNITVSIYNILTLYELLEFFDQVFPATLVHCQFADSKNNMLSALNFPNRDLIINNLTNIQKLKCYQNDPLLQSFIDGVIMHYENNFQLDLEKLKTFFEFNDKLDQSRNIKLADYIPELEAARKLV